MKKIQDSEIGQREFFSNIKNEYKFGLLIGMTMVIAMVMIVVAMFLYDQSGAAQIDLSRPGYERVRAEMDTRKIEEYNSTGPLDEASVIDFKQLFDKEYEQIQDVDVFGGDPLSDQIIGVN